MNAQSFKNARTFIDPSYSAIDETQLHQMLIYFVKQVKSGKLLVYNHDNLANEPMTIAAFDSACLYSNILVYEKDEVTNEAKASVSTSKSSIKKIRVISDMVFNEKTKKMEVEVKELDFLVPVVSAENIFMGYTERFYIKL